MKRFIKLADLKMQKAEMQQVVGGGKGEGLRRKKPPEVHLMYGIIVPLYGILRYAIPLPQPEYGITPVTDAEISG